MEVEKQKRSRLWWLQRPPRYVIASTLTAMGGFLLGIDIGIIGPVTIMPDYIAVMGSFNASVHGIIVSCIQLAAVPMSFIAGKPADVFGRPQSIAFGIAVFGFGCALQAGAVNLAMFMVGRVFEGFGFGLFFGNLTVYVCEISPPKVRGPLTDGPQFMICCGIAVGYFTCYGTERIAGSLSWRLPFIILVVLAVILVISMICYLPPSPRWLRLHGRDAEADATWDKLEVKFEDRQLIEEQDVEASVETGHKAQPTDNKEKEDSSSFEESGTSTPAIEKPIELEAGFFELFAKDVRLRTLLAIYLMGFLQLSGIDAILYYAPLLFQQAGLSSDKASFFASGVNGIVLVLISIPAMLYADKWKRRTCTLFGGISLTVTIFLIGILYATNSVHPTHGAARWVVIVCIYLFGVFFAGTWAVSIKVYTPEIQPQRTRAKATVIAHGFCWICNWFVAFITPIILEKSSSGVYFLFGGCCALTTIVCYFFMIETKGKHLDEIEAAFNGDGFSSGKAKGVKLMNFTKRIVRKVKR